MGKVQSAHSKGDETNDAEAEVQRAALSLFTIKYSELTILETLSNSTYFALRLGELYAVADAGSAMHNSGER
jgi:hypothetical protein